MSLFNHDLVVDKIIDPVDKSETWHIILHYDNAFGERKIANCCIDACGIREIKVGGTATTGIVVRSGKVICPLDDKVLVLVGGKSLECLSLDYFEIGDNVTVFEHMNHEPRHFGNFNLAATKRHVSNFNLNSIRIIGCDDVGNEVLNIYIDPYTGCINNDNTKMDSARI